MIYSYIRVSKKTMNNERQIRNVLAKYPQAKIIQEVHTRTSFTGR